MCYCRLQSIIFLVAFWTLGNLANSLEFLEIQYKYIHYI